MLGNDLLCFFLKILIAHILLNHLVLSQSSLLLIHILNIFTLPINNGNLHFVIHDVRLFYKWIRYVICPE